MKGVYTKSKNNMQNRYKKVDLLSFVKNSELKTIRKDLPPYLSYNIKDRYEFCVEPLFGGHMYALYDNRQNLLFDKKSVFYSEREIGCINDFYLEIIEELNNFINKLNNKRSGNNRN